MLDDRLGLESRLGTLGTLQGDIRHEPYQHRKSRSSVGFLPFGSLGSESRANAGRFSDTPTYLPRGSQARWLLNLDGKQLLFLIHTFPQFHFSIVAVAIADQGGWDKVMWYLSFPASLHGTCLFSIGTFGSRLRNPCWR
jgi:hypothetical protein